MSTGSCKYSTNCRFHHPDPIALGGQDTSSGYQNGGSSQPRAPPAQLPITSWPVQQNPTEPVPFLDTASPYVTGYFLPPQGLHPSPEWNGYQVMTAFQHRYLIVLDFDFTLGEDVILFLKTVRISKVCHIWKKLRPIICLFSFLI